MQMITKLTDEIHYRLVEFWWTEKYYGKIKLALGLDSDIWQELRSSLGPPGSFYMDNIHIRPAAVTCFVIAEKYDRKDGYVWWSDPDGLTFKEKLP